MAIELENGKKPNQENISEGSGTIKSEMKSGLRSGLDNVLGPIRDALENIKSELQIKDNREGVLNRKLRDLEVKLSENIENQKNLKEDIEKQKINTIETLGIFVALFTFVSIEFQVFRIYHDLYAIAGLTIIILGALLIFICVLDGVLKWKFSFKNGIFLLLSIILLVSGIFVFLMSPARDYVRDLEDIQKKISSLEEFAKSQSNEFINASSDIKVLQNEFNNLQNNFNDNTQKLIELEAKILLLEGKIKK